MMDAMAQREKRPVLVFLGGRARGNASMALASASLIIGHSADLVVDATPDMPTEDLIRALFVPTNVHYDPVERRCYPARPRKGRRRRK